MIEAVSILVLAGIIIVQAVERHIFSKTMLKQLDDCIKASMSRNLSEYQHATQPPPKDSKFVEEDSVLLDDADEETFNKFLQTQ